MEDRKGNIDNWLSDAMSDASADSPDLGWDAFDSYRKRKRRLLWIPVSLVGMIALLLGGWFWISTETDQSIPTARNSHYTPRSAEIQKPEASNLPIETEKESPSDALNSNPTKTITSELPGSNTNPEPSIVKQTKIKSDESDKLAESPIISETKNSRNIQLPIVWPKTISLDWLQGHRYPESPFTASPVEPEFDLYDYAVSSKSLYHISFEAGPALINPRYVLNSAGTAHVHKNLPGIRNQSENGAVGVSVSVHLSRNFGKLEAGIGLGVTQMNVLGNYDYQYSEHPVLDLDGTILGYRNSSTSRIRFSSDQQYTAIDIPLTVNYPLFQLKDMNFALHQRFNTQLIQSVSGTTPHQVFLDQKEIMSVSNLKPTAFSYQFGMRISGSRGPYNQWFIQPGYVKSFGWRQSMDWYSSNLDAVNINFGWIKTLKL